jgi:Kef-type K+ transport system membrane component KefB
MSLAIAYSLGGLLALAGVVISLVYVGSALATTAIGTLLPVLSDTGEMRSRFGTYLLAAGAVGESARSCCSRSSSRRRARCTTP